jgi:hypothetical protein
MTGGAERDEVFRGIIAGKLRNCLWWTTSRRTIHTANRQDAALKPSAIMGDKALSTRNFKNHQ